MASCYHAIVPSANGKVRHFSRRRSDVGWRHPRRTFRRQSPMFNPQSSIPNPSPPDDHPRLERVDEVGMEREDADGEASAAAAVARHGAAIGVDAVGGAFRPASSGRRPTFSSRSSAARAPTHSWTWTSSGRTSSPSRTRATTSILSPTTTALSTGLDLLDADVVPALAEVRAPGGERLRPRPARRRRASRSSAPPSGNSRARSRRSSGSC